MTKLLKISLATFVSFAIISNAGTLEDVKKADTLKCGVSISINGFSDKDLNNQWQGLDVDMCRAVAAAVLGDAQKVTFVTLSTHQRFDALKNGKIDLLSRNTTWTQTRDTSMGVNFAGVNYYDGQGFLVSKDLGISNAKQLDGATICITADTTTEITLAEYFTINGMKYDPIIFDTSDKVVKGFESGRCDLITSDKSQLYALKNKMKTPSKYKILPEIISKEPLGPIVRDNDSRWFNIVKWSLNAMITAEELGLTSANIDKKIITSNNPEISKIVGNSGTLGANLKLDKRWAYNIIKQVGNYGESFDRNVGMKSSLQIERGLNALWNKGGIMYSPPFR